MQDLKARCQKLILALGLGQAQDVVDVQPLTGGVASDILRFSLNDTSYCAKFALAQLKVEAVWEAPIQRNKAEYDWLEFAGQVEPSSVPKLFGRSDKENGFVMEFIMGEDVHLWKSDLLAGRVDTNRATRVGNFLGQIHSASTKPDFDGEKFQNHDDFYALRLEPYFKHLIAGHPDLEPQIRSVLSAYSKPQIALVHGDVSPKNILFRGDTPIILDAECATMGDPAFDVGFCINHLLLKAVHMPEHAHALIASAKEFWQSYSARVDWEDKAGLEARIAQILPLFMLARVDGKSPVEYLNDPVRDRVRHIAKGLAQKPTQNLQDILTNVGP